MAAGHTLANPKQQTFAAIFGASLQTIVASGWTVKVTNRALGGTGSALSSLCVDGLLSPLSPQDVDIVFLEFAVNDWAYETSSWGYGGFGGGMEITNETSSAVSIERLFRRMLAPRPPPHPQTAPIMVIHKFKDSSLMQGIEAKSDRPFYDTLHATIAAHYSVTTASIAHNPLRSDNTMWADDSHLNMKGHQELARVIIQSVVLGVKATLLSLATPMQATLPNPLRSNADIPVTKCHMCGTVDTLLHNHDNLKDPKDPAVGPKCLLEFGVVNTQGFAFTADHGKWGIMALGPKASVITALLPVSRGLLLGFMRSGGNFGPAFAFLSTSAEDKCAQCHVQAVSLDGEWSAKMSLMSLVRVPVCADGGSSSQQLYLHVHTGRSCGVQEEGGEGLKFKILSMIEMGHA